MDLSSAALNPLVSKSKWSAARTQIRQLLIHVFAHFLLEEFKVLDVHDKNGCASVSECTQNLGSKGGEVVANNDFLEWDFPMETTRNLVAH